MKTVQKFESQIYDYTNRVIERMEQVDDIEELKRHIRVINTFSKIIIERKTTK